MFWFGVVLGGSGWFWVVLGGSRELMGPLMDRLVSGKSEAAAKAPSNASAPAASPKKSGKADSFKADNKSSKRKKKDGSTSETGLGSKVRCGGCQSIDPFLPS